MINCNCKSHYPHKNPTNDQTSRVLNSHSSKNSTSYSKAPNIKTPTKAKSRAKSSGTSSGRTKQQLKRKLASAEIPAPKSTDKNTKGLDAENEGKNSRNDTQSKNRLSSEDQKLIYGVECPHVNNFLSTPQGEYCIKQVYNLLYPSIPIGKNH